MDIETSPARAARSRHRHDLRTLTYITLDQANGGIIRNLSHEGIAAQMVAAVRPRQQVRLRFELRYPRLRVETRGEVVWATFSGQCGIRFLDLSPRTARQIDEWILGNLLEGIPLHSGRERSIFAGPIFADALVAAPATNADRIAVAEDGLMVSPAALKVIELPTRRETQQVTDAKGATARHVLSTAGLSAAESAAGTAADLDWLSQPLSSRGLAWTVNALTVVASLLLFVLVFLAVTRELPKWPVAMAAGAAICVTALYWGFFKLFGGTSPGARLARLAGYDIEGESEVEAARFR
jgi:hypothetical protein